MGWTFVSHGRKAPTVAAELQWQCLRWEHLPEEQQPTKVAHATGAGVVAFAVRYPKALLDTNPGFAAHYEPAPDGSITFALVILYKDGREFGWKDMDELSGPYEPVSASILKHLSRLRTESSESARWAQRWRDDCAAYSERKGAAAATKKALCHGARVKLAAPLNYGAFTADTFTVVISFPRGREVARFRAPNGALCQVPGRALASATVTAPRVEVS